MRKEYNRFIVQENKISVWAGYSVTKVELGVYGKLCNLSNVNFTFIHPTKIDEISQ